ncbi:hypothetical protein HPB48_002783 [Haemaphysalis longicornis]|uniref:Uncharacterized protein n=1 Tax=Haemaphysalis longicornis TaxID=44386 RepID=A0A9J6GEP6_HAELO|nr:hypothetical protein HPB48_002783 [Haemaphysalis longicornis]
MPRSTWWDDICRILLSASSVSLAPTASSERSSERAYPGARCHDRSCPMCFPGLFPVPATFYLYLIPGSLSGGGGFPLSVRAIGFASFSCPPTPSWRRRRRRIPYIRHRRGEARLSRSRSPPHARPLSSPNGTGEGERKINDALMVRERE